MRSRAISVGGVPWKVPIQPIHCVLHRRRNVSTRRLLVVGATYRSCNLALPKGVLHDGFSLSGWSKFDRNEDGSLKLGPDDKPIKTGSGLWVGLRLPSSKKATAKKGAKGGKGALAESGI